MTTRNPRIAVTVTPATHALLKRIATHNQSSASALIGELLREATPGLVRIARALDALRSAAESKHREIKAVLEDAQRDAEKSASTAFALLDRIAASPARGSGGGEARDGAPSTRTGKSKAGRSRRRPASPPSANRGDQT